MNNSSLIYILLLIHADTTGSAARRDAAQKQRPAQPARRRHHPFLKIDTLKRKKRNSFKMWHSVAVNLCRMMPFPILSCE
jgi:hypothetical protein